jgi:hypothetical protein
VVQGDYGLRVLEGCQLSAKQLQTMHDSIKKALKNIKGAALYVAIVAWFWLMGEGTCVCFRMCRFASKATRRAWARAKGPLSTGKSGGLLFALAEWLRGAASQSAHRQGHL